MTTQSPLGSDDRDNWRRVVEQVVGEDLDPPVDCRSCGASIHTGGLAELHLWATVEDDDLLYSAHGPVCWECSHGEIPDGARHTDARTCLAIGRVAPGGGLDDVQIYAVEAPSAAAEAYDMELPR